MVIVKYIPNILHLDGRQEKELPYSRDYTLKDYLKFSDFNYAGMKIIVSGKVVKNLDTPLDNCDEIIITPEIGISLGFAVPWFIDAFVFYASVAIVVASVAYSIYQAVTYKAPSMPSFDTNAGVGGLDESSPTYGWEGIQTTQEVGLPVPIVYGKHKVGGNIINAYISTDGDQNYLNVLLGLCEGEVESISDIKINDQPIANFAGCSYTTKVGTNTDAVIPNFEELHSVQDLNITLNNLNDYHNHLSILTTIQGFEVRLKFPSGIFYQNETDGSINNWQVTYKIEYKLHTDSVYTTAGTWTVDVKNRTEIKRYQKITGLTAGQYDIKVTRTSATGDFYHIGDMTLVSIDEIRTADLSYPNLAKLGVKALATSQLSGGMPQLSCIVKGRKIKTPNVIYGGSPVAYEDYYYDPATALYKRFSDNAVCTWNNDYITAFSANPIWCLYDLLVNKRFGLGSYIDTTIITDSEWATMSQYCDEKVSDGDSGYEKRFRMDLVIDSAGRAIDVLQQLTGCFRGLIFYSGGLVKVKIDKEDTPVQLFTMANISTGSFKQSWRSKKEVVNVIDVQFMDEDQNYKQDQITVIDETAITAGDPIRKKQIKVFCTRISQALREGKYALNSSKYVTRSVTFRAFIDALACQVGDLISISHDVPQWGFSGKINTGSTITLVKLDQAVTIEAGKNYKLRIRFANDTIEEQDVNENAGTYTELHTDAFANAPAEYDKYAFGEENKVKKDFRILGMKRANENEIDITAIEYNSTIYDTDTIALPTNNISALTTEIPDVSNLSLTEGITAMPDGTIQDYIDVWFRRPELVGSQIHRYSKAKIYLSENAGTTYTYAGETFSDSFRIVGGIADGKTYRVAVVSISEDKQENAIADSPYADITIVGKTAPPADVTGFGVAFATDHLEFTWIENTDVDLWGYEIRELPSAGASWGSGIVVTTKVGGGNYSHFIFSAGTKYYAIKAIDTSGNYSTNYVSASVVISSIPDQNVVATFEDTDFSGSLSGDAELCWIKGYSENYFRKAISFRSDILWDIGNWDDGGFWDKDFDMASTGVYITPVKDLGASFNAGVTLEIGLVNIEGGNLQIEIAYSDSDPAPTNWTNFVSGSYTGRYFRFRLTLSTANASYGIDLFKFKAIFDVPDKTAQENNVAVAGSGWTTINLSGFTSIKTLIISVRGGAYVIETAETAFPTSFDIKLKDPANAMAQVAGAVNYFVKGY
jgi:predicted phage tail protein